MHATILALLGIEDKKLTHRFNGRDMRLIDVSGDLIPKRNTLKACKKISQGYAFFGVPLANL